MTKVYEISPDQTISALEKSLKNIGLKNNYINEFINEMKKIKQDIESSLNKLVSLLK